MQQASMSSVTETCDCEEEPNVLLARNLNEEERSAAGTNNAVDEQTKMQLAKRVSQVSSPGVVAEQSNNSTFRPKPSAGQLEQMGNLRCAQKNHAYHQNREENLAESIHADEEQPLDSVQGRMTEFRDKENQRINMDDEERRKRKKKRIIWVALAIGVGIVVVGTAVAVALSSDSSGLGAEEINDVETKAFHDCYMRDGIDPSNRFLQLRSVVSSVQGWNPSSIDSVGSTQRAAVCWLADFDRFKSEIVKGSEYEAVQRLALAAVYFHFVGTSPVEMGSHGLSGSNWLDNVHVCEWDFVACDSPSNGVTELFLDGLDLKKPIPEEMVLMSDLTHLKLTRSQLTGQIPTVLSLLTQLQVLDLSFNELESTIPPEIGFASQLRTLSLDQNRLEGEIPSQLFKIPQLLDLSLAFNNLSGTLPNALGNATALTRIAVHANALIGTIPDISWLTNLESIGLGDTLIDGAFPDISRLTNLGEKTKVAYWFP